MNVRIFSILTALAIGVTSVQAVRAYDTNIAKQCDKEIGIPVPNFNCDEGTLVPTTVDGVAQAAGGAVPPFCDRPNVLNSSCDPGSRFQVLTNTLDGFVIAHCRRKGNPLGQYSDIAIIQHNKINGATCFYQGNLTPTAGAVIAPVDLTPSSPVQFQGDNTGCASCHDNGPVIRTPYLTQIKSGLDVLPGAGDKTFNGLSEKYRFVGNDLRAKIHVNIHDKNSNANPNQCTSCHTLSMWGDKDPLTGFTNIMDINSAGHLAATSTASTQPSRWKNGSQIGPRWMPLNSTSYDPVADAATNEIIACAEELKKYGKIDGFGGYIKTIDLSPTRTCEGVLNTSMQTFNNFITLPRDKCLTVDATESSGQRGVKASDCSTVNVAPPATSPQKWHYNAETKELAIDGFWCLDTGITVFDGMPVTTSACNGTQSQKWEIDLLSSRIKNIQADKCLGVTPGQLGVEGADMQLSNCVTESVLVNTNLKHIADRYLIAAADSSKALTLSGSTVAANTFATIPQTTWIFEKAKVESVRTEAGTGKTKTKVNVYYRIRNKDNYKQLLTLTNGVLAASVVDPNLTSAQWLLTNRAEGAVSMGNGNFSVPGKKVYMIQNRADLTKYIKYASGNVTVGSLPSATSGGLSSDSIKWVLKDNTDFPQ